MRHLLFLLFAFLFFQGIFAVQLQYPPTIQEITATVTIRANGSIAGTLGSPIIIKVLGFQETAEQSISSLEQVLEINGKTIDASTETDSYGNRYATFKVNETGEFSYRIEAMIHKRVVPKYLRDFDLNKGIGEEEQYLKETKYIQSRTAAIRTLALNRFTSNSWLENIAEITDWTHKYVTYDASYYPETYSAIETLMSRKGTCDEFAVLTAAMLRAKGIPARVIVGPVFSAEQWNFHGWIEAYNPNSGWVAIDSTYGEAGIVDATHIEMGRFPDFDYASDIIIAPTTAQTELQPKAIEVNVIDSKQFSDVISLEAENVEMRANNWHDLNVLVENRIGSNIIVPMEIAMPEGFSVDEKSKVILLKPFEKKVVSWKTIIVKELAKNQYLQGTYWVLSLHPGIERTVRVLPEILQQAMAQIEVQELFSFIEGDTLKIELSLENKGSDAGNAEITVKSEDREIKKVAESIEAFAKKTVVISVENYLKKPYVISVESQGMRYAATIMPEEAVASENGTAVKETGVVEENKQIRLEELLNEQILIYVIIILSIGIILLLLKELIFK